MGEEQFFDASGEPAVRGLLDRSEKLADGILLAHGAGSDCRAPLLAFLASAFTQAGYTVLRCDLPFRQRRPHGPPSPGAAAADQAGLIRAIAALRAIVPGKVFVGGSSYGGRQATMAVAEHPGIVAGMLLLSYPLHAPGKPGQQRTKHFPQLEAPCLFVQGTKDPFGSPEEMEAALTLIPGRHSLLLVDGVGHDLGYSRKKADPATTGQIVSGFLEFVG